MPSDRLLNRISQYAPGEQMPLSQGAEEPRELPPPPTTGPDGYPIATKDELGMGWKMMPSIAALADGGTTYGLMKSQPWKEELNPLFSPIKNSPEGLLAAKMGLAALAYHKMNSSKHTRNPGQRKRDAIIMTALPALASVLNAYQIANKPPTTTKLK